MVYFSIILVEYFSVIIYTALGELKGKGAGSGAQANGKNWDWYQKNDIKALAAMEKENPALFKKLLDEYENSL